LKPEEFERLIDVFEKLTAHSEFMESEESCKLASQKFIPDLDPDIFKQIYEFWR